MPKTITRKRPKHPQDQWDEKHYVDTYVLARSGLSDRAIAKKLGISHVRFMQWKELHPALKHALSLARANQNKVFREYVYNRLPPDLQELWEDINACEREPDAYSRVEAILSNQGKDVRQHLFLYALIHCNFNQSEACRTVNITRDCLNLWKQDPKFCKLVDEEMRWHLGNFYEEGLVNMVRSGDGRSTIFVNQTFNRDRGYNLKHEMDVNHKGQINHVHAVIDIDTLNLPLEVRTAILDALRKQQTQPALDAEVVDTAQQLTWEDEE